jgi:hypothetical protein
LLLMQVLAAVAAANLSRTAANEWAALLLGPGRPPLGGGGACDTAFVFCALSQITPIQLTGLNLYDVREQCKIPPLCYDFSLTEEFLNLPATQAELGVKREWRSHL